MRGAHASMGGLYWRWRISNTRRLEKSSVALGWNLGEMTRIQMLQRGGLGWHWVGAKAASEEMGSVEGKLGEECAASVAAYLGEYFGGGAVWDSCGRAHKHGGGCVRLGVEVNKNMWNLVKVASMCERRVGGNMRKGRAESKHSGVPNGFAAFERTWGNFKHTIYREGNRRMGSFRLQRHAEEWGVMMMTHQRESDEIW